MRYIKEHGISVLSYWDSDYPTQLKQFIDSLILLFSKGKLVWDKDLNSNNDITINLATKNYVRGVYFLKISKLSIQSYRESYPKLSLVYNLHDESG